MLSILGALAVGAAFQTPQGPAFSSQLRTLVVFKEGFGFYVREGAAKLENGWATTNLVPQAVSGTLWVYPKNPADRVDTIILTRDNRIEFDKPEDLRTELANKVGLNLRIVTDNRQVFGRLTNLLDKMLLVQDPSKNYVAIEYTRIESVALVDFPVRIKLRTAKPDGSAGIGLAYVQEGVRWQPNYLLELNGKSGRLTLRGTLLNLEEALESANVVFVVGAPALVNRGSIDELLQGFMSGPLLGGSGGGSGQGGAGAPEAKRAARDAAETKPSSDFRSADPSFGVVTSDETSELQYYTKPGFTLRPGERAMATIFEIEIPLDPLFEWDADGESVTYILTLENKSAQPFTTGPVFVVEGQRPVGQQNITYTPPGGKTELRLAKGLGLKVARTESELKRGDPFRVGQENYLPITLQGKLTLENFRKEDAQVRVLRNLVGKVLDLGPDGMVKNVEVSRTGPNTTSRAEWKLTVPAGRKLEVVYSYEAYSSLGR